MIPKYTLSPLAIDDLREIWRYGTQQWGLAQTERYGETLLAAFDFLAENPQAGHSMDAIKRGYRRHSVGAHRIFYRLAPGCVEVIRILHQSMDTERHLQS